MSPGIKPASSPRILQRTASWLSGVLLAASLARAEVPLLPYPELLQLIRTHVAEINEQELESVAASALLARVRGRVLAPGETAEPISHEPAIIDRQVYDGCAYVRVGQVTLALAPQLTAALQKEDLTQARGLVLDLRFASGDDYLAAANVVSLFLATETRVLSWGDRIGMSMARTNAWLRPVAVLVNRQTRGAAEAIAAALRQQRSGLILGGRTAGESAVYKEVPLEGDGGRRLRLAVATVKTGDGKPVPADGVEPDIEVKVGPEQDRAYLADPYARQTGAQVAGAGEMKPGGSGSAGPRKRVSEADLVRKKRELGARSTDVDPAPGESTLAPESNKPGEGDEPIKIVQDPVLARALDLLKGLTLLGARKP